TQSIVAPEAFTTLLHLAVSCWIMVVNACGVPGKGSAPRDASLALTSGAARILSSCACSLVTISAGVPFGATSPNQMVTSKLGNPDSAIAGTLGSASDLLRPVTPRAFTLPAEICG